MKNFGSDYKKLVEEWLSDHSKNYTCYGKRLYSKDNKLFSYGPHYVIAKILGKQVIVNSNYFSETTKRQKQIIIKTAKEKEYKVDEFNPRFNSIW